MSIQDYLKLLKRNLKLVIGLPVLCLIIGLAYAQFISPKYVATASLVTNGDAPLAQGFANNIVDSDDTLSDELEITVSLNSAAKKVIIDVKGSDSETCISTANNIANSAADRLIEATEIYFEELPSNVQFQNSELNVVALVTEAKSTSAIVPSLIKTAVVWFMGGLLAALCLIIITDMVKAPIKSRAEVEHLSNLPILSKVSAGRGGERLLANLRFCCAGMPNSIALVPVGTGNGEYVVASELNNALEDENVESTIIECDKFANAALADFVGSNVLVAVCPSLDDKMVAAYIAHDADATVLCVTELVSTKSQLSSVLEELALAKSNVVGIAYVVSEKTK